MTADRSPRLYAARAVAFGGLALALAACGSSDAPSVAAPGTGDAGDAGASTEAGGADGSPPDAAGDSPSESGDGAAGRGDSGGPGDAAPADTGADAGADTGDGARACDTYQCFRAIRCVLACGGTPTYVGCCPCDAPAFDDVGCGVDAAAKD